MTIGYEMALDRHGLRGFPLLVVILALSVLMIDGIDLQLLSLVAPVIIEEWGVSRTAFGSALAAALFGMALGSLAGGWIGDRIGRRRALVIFTLVFGLATVAAGYTNDVATMTVVRVIGGLGFGAAGPNALALACEWVPARNRSQVVSLLSIGTPAGGMIGASLVLLLLTDYGWDGTFIICGAGTVLAAVILWFVLRESPSWLLGRGRQAEASRAAAPVLRRPEELAVAAADPHRALSEAATDTDLRPVALSDRSLLRLNIGAGLAFFLLALVAYGQLAWTPVMLTSAGFALETGLVAIFSFNLSSVLCASASGFLIRYFGSRIVMLCAIAGLVLALAGLWMLLEAASGGTDGEGGRFAIALVGMCGGTAGAAIASIYAMMAEGYPQSCRGAGLGLGLTLGRAGGIMLSLVGGAILDLAADSNGPFLSVLIASSLVAAAGAFISDRHARPIIA